MNGEWGRQLRRGSYRRWAPWIIAPVLAMAACLAPATISTRAAGPVGGTPRQLPIGYAGVDYYYPTDYFTHCPQFTWLQLSCWDNPALADSPRDQLLTDLNYVRSHHIVSTMRVWVSLDQLMLWSPATGFGGWEPGAFARVDDMLSLFHRYGIHVVLVLLSYARGTDLNQFHPEALDGDHQAMRANYLLAIGQFMSHLEANPIDRETDPFIELQNEPYFQLERYFSNPGNLGSYSGCASDGTTDWGCVDTRIIHPWLEAVYRTAEKAAPTGFYFTFSDTERLFRDYSYWSKMYPEDIIDEHVYDSQPWLHASLYRNGTRFGKPWIVTEAGCNVGDIGCTYNGTAARTVDQWWISNLRLFGAQSVMVESHVTLWTYPDGPASLTPTPVGVEARTAVLNHLAAVISRPASSRPSPIHAAPPDTKPIFNNFDHLPVGPLSQGQAQRHAAGRGTAALLKVERSVFRSAPNGLSVTMERGRSAFVARYPAWPSTGFHLHFDLRLPHSISLGRHGYIELAKFRLAHANRLSVIVGLQGRLSLCSGRGLHTEKCRLGSRRLKAARWYRVSVTDGARTAVLSVNGCSQAKITARAATPGRLRYAALGFAGASRYRGSRGPLYLDNVWLGTSRRRSTARVDQPSGAGGA